MSAMKILGTAVVCCQVLSMCALWGVVTSALGLPALVKCAGKSFLICLMVWYLHLDQGGP